MVQRLRWQGKTVLPLGLHEQDLLQRAFACFPAGIGPEGLYIVEQENNKKGTVTVVSMNGSGFNRVLALLLRHRLGPTVQVRYNDFVLNVNRAGKDAAGERVAQAVREIQSMDYPAIAAILPLLPANGWKFASALPELLFREMVISDHYHGEDFLQTLNASTVTCLLTQEQDHETA
jgi:hypothetical protein